MDLLFLCLVIGAVQEINAQSQHNTVIDNGILLVCAFALFALFALLRKGKKGKNGKKGIKGKKSKKGKKGKRAN